MFIAANPPMGAVITYWINEYAPEDVKIGMKLVASIELVDDEMKLPVFRPV